MQPNTFSLFNLGPEKGCFSDRFIPRRYSFEDMDKSLINKNRKKVKNESEEENNENKMFNNILKKNLKIDKKRNKNRSNLNFTDKIEIPKKCFNKFRKIRNTPFKVLDAPFLQDDYYLNVLDWSSKNNLAVGLGNTTYMWNFDTNTVDKITCFDDYNLVSSICWNKEGDKLVIGSLNGGVELWDPIKKKKIYQWDSHEERVGAISLFGDNLLTGSRDRKILYFDLRRPIVPVKKYLSHKQEVCGIRWSPTGDYFASGGNDNKLFVYSPKTTIPLFKKNHKAAVKALAWSHKQIGLLATGAGTADRCIRLWNINERKLIQKKDTNSQICNLVFSKIENEIITTHGFSNNEINVWGIKGIKKLCTLTGHTSRVLYLSLSPCGNFIVTGAGDETLRFWNLSDMDADKKNKNSSISFFQPKVLR